MRPMLARAGAFVLALAPLLWIVPGMDDGATVVGFVVAAAGFALAGVKATSSRPRSLGFLLVFVGLLPFFINGFLPIQVDGYLVAILLFMAGTLLAAASSWNAGSRPWMLTAGALLMGIAGCIWVPLDWGSVWEFGNATALVGAALLAFGAQR